MGVLHKFLAVTYPLLRVKNKFIKQEGKGRLRVLLYHDILPDEIDLFNKQIQWLSRNWKFITPQEFESIMTSDMQISQDSLLLTFDDGFFSNRTIVEKVLEPLNIKAIFFVVSKFAALLSRKDAQQFISKNIYPKTNEDELLPHQFNMNWDDLKFLCESGHTIGGHTATHARLSELSNVTKLKDEIAVSANVIEEQLGIKVKHFAYTFGDLASFSTDALAVASERFDYVYSGLRGVNTQTTSPYAIRRDSVTPHDPISLIGAFLEGGVDSRYRCSREVLDDWVRNET
jgi:peptidoglycan/xylan/chitin deacetylase (PgdA/CDA1 family)